MHPTQTTAGRSETKVFRGRSLEEVLPRIKAELGPDAVITRQRDGLAGGIGGFFQRQFIEVEAHAGEQHAAAGRASAPPPARLDVLDDGPAAPGPPPVREPLGPDFDAPASRGAIDDATAEGLSSPGIQEVLGQAAPFVERRPTPAPDLSTAFPVPSQAPPRPAAPAAAPPAGLAAGAASPFSRELDRAQRADAEPAPPAPDPPPARPARGARPAGADAVERTLTDAGLSAALAAEVVAETVSHLVPFGSARAVKRLARTTLARRILVQGSVGTGGRTVAFVGSGGAGKTLCTARIAAAYAEGSDLPVTCVAVDPDDGGARLAALLRELGVEVKLAASAEDARAYVRAAGGRALVAIDTPAISPRDGAGIRALGRVLSGLPALEIHLALPATASAAAARDLIGGFSALGSLNLALTHADETEHMGAPVDIAIECGRPLSFVGRGTLVPGGLEPADALAVATLVLP